MYTVQSAANSWDIMTGKRADNANSSSQSIFGATFKSVLAAQTGGGVQEMLDRLAARFSDADVSKGKPGEGAKGTGEYFGNEEGDKVAVDENLLAAMFGDSGLAQKVEEAISKFFDSGAGADAPFGSTVQRSVSISITAVRYNVSQFDSESGELMSAQEMMTSLQEKMDELIDRMFGMGGAKGNEEAEDGTEGVDAPEEAGAAGKGQSGSNYQSFSFSMEMFWSSQMLNGTGGEEGGVTQGGRFSLSAMASGSFQDFSGRVLPSAIYDALRNSDDFSGPFTSLLDEGLGQFGMQSSGFQFSMSGFSLKAGSANNTTDLMGWLEQLMNNRSRPENPVEAVEPQVEDVPAEVPAEAVA